jgi:hypothetical protein
MNHSNYGPTARTASSKQQALCHGQAERSRVFTARQQRHRALTVYYHRRLNSTRGPEKTSLDADLGADVIADFLFYVFVSAFPIGLQWYRPDVFITGFVLLMRSPFKFVLLLHPLGYNEV